MEAEKAPRKKSLRAEARKETRTEVQELSSLSSSTTSPVPADGPAPPQIEKSMPELAETAKLAAAELSNAYRLPLAGSDLRGLGS